MPTSSTYRSIYLGKNIFVHILKNILREKTFVHLVLALVGHVLAVVEGAVDRGAAVKEVADLENMIIVIMIIMFTHDYNHHIHS